MFTIRSQPLAFVGGFGRPRLKGTEFGQNDVHIMDLSGSTMSLGVYFLVHRDQLGSAWGFASEVFYPTQHKKYRWRRLGNKKHMEFGTVRGVIKVQRLLS